jgi:uncharacterized repeat protein (TIGR01451 family)
MPLTSQAALHGAAILKNPVGPDGVTPRAHRGDTVTATIEVLNLDGFGDSITVTNIFDVVHNTSGDTTTGNLLPGGTPVTLTNSGDFIDVVTTYVVAADQTNPLTDDAKTGGFDNHDGPGGTGVPQSFFLTFPGTVSILIPCINITKECTYPEGATCFVLGQPVVFSGIVSNCGNTTLSGIVVTDAPPATITFNPTTSSGNTYTGVLTNGETVGYSGSYTPTTCGSQPDTVTALGTDDLGLTVTNSASTSCEVCCPPQICVTKGVVCAPDDGSACSDALTYAPSATGAAGPTNQAAFCYKIVVTNCGSDVLTNVTVVDNLLGAVAGSFTNILGIGESATNFYKQSYAANTSNTNTVTATGTGQASGITTNAVASAVATVLPVSVACDITLSSDVVVEGANSNCEVTLDAANGGNQPVHFTLVVTNTGQVDLNVSLAGVPALVSCSNDTTAIVVPASVFIPVGGSYTLDECVLVSCPGTNFDVTVQGTATNSTGTICISDANGNDVTTAPSHCTACVACVTPVTCRTTGGGVLIATNVDDACSSEVPFGTVIRPTTSLGGLAITKVTHGGQVGAPYSHQDCGEVLGNPCIRGQWEHNRHFQNVTKTGKVESKDVITAFHTTTPKGQFDALTCACLPCCTNAAGDVNQPNGNFFGHTNHFVLCNPDDHRICGPEPRPAPANALIWSGVGELKNGDLGNGNNKPGEWVIIRVYIVDRSEPGGGHPKGAIPPADIYCFQAWKTGISTTKKPDFSLVATALRTAIAQDACAFLNGIFASGSQATTISVPSDTITYTDATGSHTVTADFVDCGPLYDGNRQIHPSTGATCTQ